MDRLVGDWWATPRPHVRFFWYYVWTLEGSLWWGKPFMLSFISHTGFCLSFFVFDVGGLLAALSSTRLSLVKSMLF